MQHVWVEPMAGPTGLVLWVQEHRQDATCVGGTHGRADGSCSVGAGA